MSNDIELIYLRLECLLQLTSKVNCTEVAFSVFYEIEYIKSMSCKANLPKFSYITSPHIHWLSASHFQSRDKLAKLKTVIPRSCNKFISICKYKISVLSSSDFRLFCTVHSCYSKQPFKREKNCTWNKGCERYKVHMVEWNKIIVSKLLF